MAAGQRTVLTGIAAGLGLGLFAAPLAQAVPVKLDYVDMAHGTVLYDSAGTGGACNGGGTLHSACKGVAIYGDEYKRNRDVVALFVGDDDDGNDPDLQEPLTPATDIPELGIKGVTLQDGDRLLVIQEQKTGCYTGVCTEPDDTVRGGLISFDFGELGVVELNTLQIADIDEGNQDESLTFRVTDVNTGYLLEATLTGDHVGHEKAAEIDFQTLLTSELATITDPNNANAPVDATEIGIIEVLSLDVLFSSSGAITNLTFDTTDIPAPAPLAVLLAGLGLLALRRR